MACQSERGVCIATMRQTKREARKSRTFALQNVGDKFGQFLIKRNLIGLVGLVPPNLKQALS